MVRSGSWGGVNESDEDERRAVLQVQNMTYTQIDVANGPDAMARERPLSPMRIPELCEEESLRRKLAFFFMNPIEKFLARRQTPWKLFLQFVKVILVTTQLMIFGNFRFAHTNFYSNTQISFEHLFFKDWDSVREVMAYPPATGAYALYKKQSFYDLFDYAAKTFLHLEDLTVNPINKTSNLGFCVYATKGTGPTKEYLTMLPKTCIEIPDANLTHFKSSEYLPKVGFDIPWYTLHTMHINFTVRAKTFRELGYAVNAECFVFKIFIEFSNSDHDGQIPIALTMQPERVRCNHPEIEDNSTDIRIIVLNYVVIAVSGVSLILCMRALMRAQSLRVETQRFFRAKFKSDLTFEEHFEFLNLWYVVICINDVLIIVGSTIVLMIETKKSTADLWDFCCVFLGTGDLLVWIGMLRYLGFFRAYNALILTLKGSLPNVARFAICTAFVYAGYTFCGWLVFAPYHFKFTTLSSTSETLFSLVNGDDMFATFSMLSAKDGLVHTFSRIYLYTFVMLFIYVVLSLFIAIIMDTYEKIKSYYEDGFPQNRVDKFYKSRVYDPYSNDFYDGSGAGLCYLIYSWTMTRVYGRRWRGYDRMAEDSRRTAYRERPSRADRPSVGQVDAAGDNVVTATPPTNVEIVS